MAGSLLYSQGRAAGAAHSSCSINICRMKDTLTKWREHPDDVTLEFCSFERVMEKDHSDRGRVRVMGRGQNNGGSVRVIEEGFP